MAEPVSKQKPSDEIDLSQFFNWIGRGFRNFGHNVIGTIADIRELFFINKLFFAIIIISGLVIGLSYSKFLKKNYYKSSMILSCDYLNSRIMESAIEKLNLLCAENQKESLAETLNVDIEVAKNIRNFSFKPFVSETDLVEIEVLREQLNSIATQKRDIVEKAMSKINIENKHAFQIEVFIFNPDIVKNLEKAMVEYFGANEYIKSRIAISRENLKERKKKLERESAKLDSLKIVLFQNYQAMASQSKQGSNNVILGDKNVPDALGIYAQDLNLNSEILDIQSKLYIKSDFEVIDGFAVFKEPESASTFKILVISFFVSIGFGYLIIALWKFDRYLSAVSKKQKLENQAAA